MTEHDEILAASETISDDSLAALSAVLSEFCSRIDSDIAIVRRGELVQTTRAIDGSAIGNPKPLRDLVKIYLRGATNPDPPVRSVEQQQRFYGALLAWARSVR
jgi:hypothetical protein